MTGKSTRREFIRASGGAVMAASLVPHGFGFQNGSRETLRVGLIGCGGRGRGAAAQALRADPDVELVALADAFADQVDDALSTLQNTENIQGKISPNVQ
jgi:hypothetical protein